MTKRKILWYDNKNSFDGGFGMVKKYLISALFLLCLVYDLFSLKASAVLHVTNPYIEGSAKPERYILVGETYTVYSILGTATNFESSDSSIATINEKGELRAKKPGEVKITVRVPEFNNKKDTSIFHVVKRADAIRLNFYQLYLARGYTNYPVLMPEITPSDATDVVRFRSETDEKKPVYANRLTGVTRVQDINGSAVVTAYGKLDEYILDEDESFLYDHDMKTDTAYLYAHTHNWTVPYVAADSLYHHMRCQDSDNCPITDPKERKKYEPHDITKSGICRICGYRENLNHTHTWQTTYTSDKKNHWYSCSGCDGKKDLGSHNFGEDNKCITCGLRHVHNNWTDKISANDAGHWYACLDCDARKNYTPHSSVNPGNCKQEVYCDTCTMPFQYGPHSDELVSTSHEYSHQQKCPICGETFTAAPHTYQKESENTSKCTECGFVHTHTWSDWTAEREGHRHTCTKQQVDLRGKLYSSENEILPHTYGDDMLCTVCGYDGNTPNCVNDTYELSTAGEALWFARLVNGGKTAVNAVLKNDLVLNETNLPIGTLSSPYQGIFDGQGYTVTLNVPDAGNQTGFFGAASGAVIRNFTVDGSITVNQGVKHIGGAVGVAKGGTVVSNVLSKIQIRGDGAAHHLGGIVGSSQVLDGTLLIENCMFEGYLNLPSVGDCLGGILGYANSQVSIRNCGSTGTVAGVSGGHIGGILGYVNHTGFGVLENCWFSSRIDGGGIVGTINNASDGIRNNFCSEGVKPVGKGKKANNYTAGKIKDWHSGEVAWRINRGAGEEIWYQNLENNNSYPVFSGKNVYRNGQDSYTNQQPKNAFYCEDQTVFLEYLEKPSLLAAAVYRNGRLQSVKLKEISAPGEIKFSELALEKTAEDQMKIMLLSDLKTMTPLCAYYQE